MIISLIRKHSGVCTALALLLALIAAPYLLPANPDSAVFRSGSLPLLLLGMCAFPMKRALDKHSLRTLIYSAVFAFIFSVCLSLGSELRIYQQLLPGMGSLVRRLAVPCMSTPLFAGLFSYAFVHLPRCGPDIKRPIPFLAFFLPMIACYSAVLLALYPGVISYDFQHEIRQFSEGVFEAAHPVFHTLFLGSIFKLGELLFGSMTAGAALYHVVQFTLMAAMLSWGCIFIQRRVSSRIIPIALACSFAILPMHSVLSVSTSKDPLFAGLCMLLCLQLWEIAEDPDAFLGSRLKMLRFALCCLGMSLLRHNGIFAYALACVALLVLCRSKRCKALIVVLASVALAIGVPKTLELVVSATKTPSSEMMSVPCQQLMRTANYDGLSEEEFRQIERWFPNATHTYRANCADPAKGGNFHFTRYQKDPYDFWSTYGKYALRYPRIYIEAFLENCIGLWYPDDISHAHTLSNEEWEYIYLNTTYPFAPDTYPIEPDCKFPALQKILYATTHHSQHQKYPFLSQLFCPAVYSFFLLLSTLLLISRKEGKLALCTLPMWGIFISLLFSAGIFVRYAYPLMATVPLLFVLTVFSKRSN